MRSLIFLLLFWITFPVGAQKAIPDHPPQPLDLLPARSDFNTIQLAGSNEQVVYEYLISNLNNLQPPSSGLQMTSFVESPAAMHFTFRQYAWNVPVYGSQIKANVDKNGLLFALFDLTFPVPANPGTTFPTTETIDQFLGEHLLNKAELYKLEEENVYFPENGKFIPAKAIEVLTEEVSFEAVIDAEGKTLYHNDLIRYFTTAGQDSLVNARVFMPDPLTSANKVYGTPYQDLNDSNLAILNAQMMNVTVPVNFDAGVFTLEGPYVKITNYKFPAYTPASSTTPFFIYNRSEQEFEDINVFYHIHVFQEYLQSLGYNNLANYQIHAETHAYSNDNSTFVNSFNPPRLNFGEGGVDDAEDADVIIHEYCHAIQVSAAPRSVSGFERKALDEGTSDYFAASYSRGLNDYNWGNVFSWDGHNEFYAGRLVNSTKHYPDDLNGSYHENGEIWASALMDIWTALGKEKCDQLILQTIYGYAVNMNMSEAAMLVLKSDTLLYSGAHYATICDIFNARGFSTICNNYIGKEEMGKGKPFVTLSSTDRFASGGMAILTFNGPPAGSTLTLTDMTGKVLSIQKPNREQVVNLPGEGLKPGMYVLTVAIMDQQYNFKLIRY